MNDIKYIKLRTKNCKMMQMYGDKLTKSEWLRSKRTNGLHTEVEFSDRYGSISFSSTLSGGCNGCRFKMIGYSHPYRWSTVYIAVTAEQELRMFITAVEMADARYFRKYDFNEALDIYFNESIAKNDCIQGPNHIKYDKGAAFLSFISKRNIWKPSKVNMICNRACAVAMLEVWPDMLIADKNFKGVVYEYPIADFDRQDPASLTPDQLEYLARNYFERIAR